MGKLFVTDPDLVEEEEDIKQYALMTNNARLIGQTSLNKVDRKMMIDEIDEKSKIREEMMLTHIDKIDEKSKVREEEMKKKIESMSKVEDALFHELNVLHIELAVVTLACVGISLAAFFSLKR